MPVCAHCCPCLPACRSAHTRRNLARLDEDRLDYDLLEDLVAHIDSEKEEGAILVFLPGGAGIKGFLLWGG